MKNILIICLFISLLTGCGDKFTPDPSLKESERIAVLEKAKTDTLTTIVQMDDNLYIIRDNKIQSKTGKESDVGAAMVFGGLVVICLVLIAAIKT